MKKALADIVSSSIKRVHIKPGDIVVDIGANDGTLLSYYPKTITRIGFEPARAIAKDAQNHATAIIPQYFSKRPYLQHPSVKHAPSRIITTVAMFYDLENPHPFVEDIRQCLHPNGIWVNQMASLSSMVTETMFDNICHEHICYYSLATMSRLLSLHGMTIVDTETNSVNGGSMRLFIMHTKAAQRYTFPGAKHRLETFSKHEHSLHLDTKQTYETFQQTITKTKQVIRSWFTSMRSRHARIYGYGASTKGNTLLQYFSITTDDIPAIADRNPDKWGLETSGTHIPIISEEQARKDRPDYFFLLPWHFSKQCIERERDYLQSGGAFCIPLPRPRIVRLTKGTLHTSYLH